MLLVASMLKLPTSAVAVLLTVAKNQIVWQAFLSFRVFA